MPTTVVVPYPSTAPITPAASAYETEINRRNTVAYIDSDPSDIVFQARTMGDDGEGGSVWSVGSPLPPQRCRVIVGQKMEVERRTVDGKTVTPDTMLLMRWDASVAPGFTFTWRDDPYEVVWVNEDFTYQKQVEVVTRG